MNRPRAKFKKNQIVWHVIRQAFYKVAYVRWLKKYDGYFYGLHFLEGDKSKELLQDATEEHLQPAEEETARTLAR